MSTKSTNVIFLWHMHQPCYKHPTKNYYVLPWVRLHAVKNYYGMAKIIEKFDQAKVTFNFSGILLQQLKDYAKGGVKDYYQELTLKDPAHLKKKEKDFIIERFFSLNFERIIRPDKRYLQLYDKKLSARKRFTTKDLGDLQALFNLYWFHPYTVAADKNLKRLFSKGQNFSLEDKKYIIKKQYEIIAKIFPLYKRLLAKKRIELTVTPYHHPILPLIYDTDVLKDTAYLENPKRHFSSHHDCRWHLKQAKEIFKHVFNATPRGSWPSEGSISEEVARVYHGEDFKWIGTDEAILFKSLTTDYVPYDMIKKQRHIIYRPYKFAGTNIFFRDRNLSDAIGFIYQGWEDSVFAANDLMEHFKRTHSYTKDFFKERAITIIMDGENAWEYYKNSGVDFLETLYFNLEKSETLTTTTPSEFLKHSPCKKLDRLASGSWINGDFGVWAGSKKNNSCWDTLKRIKDIIDRSKANRKKIEQARNCLYLLEGSDWFWWNTFEDVSGEFKKLFLSYVERIYRLLGKKAPSYIYK